jgi:hypothetical protein
MSFGKKILKKGRGAFLFKDMLMLVRLKKKRDVKKKKETLDLKKKKKCQGLARSQLLRGITPTTLSTKRPFIRTMVVRMRRPLLMRPYRAVWT